MDTSQHPDQGTEKTDQQEQDAQKRVDIQVHHGNHGGGKHMAAGHGFSLFVPGDQRPDGPGFIGPETVDPGAYHRQHQERKGRDPEGPLQKGIQQAVVAQVQFCQQQGVGDVHEHHQGPVQQFQAGNGPGFSPEPAGQTIIGPVIALSLIHGLSFLTGPAPIPSGTVTGPASPLPFP